MITPISHPHLVPFSRAGVFTCVDNPCQGGAECVNRPDASGPNRYECRCPPTRTGRNCENTRADDLGIVEIVSVGEVCREGREGRVCRVGREGRVNIG